MILLCELLGLKFLILLEECVYFGKLICHASCFPSCQYYNMTGQYAPLQLK